MKSVTENMPSAITRVQNQYTLHHTVNCVTIDFTMLKMINYSYNKEYGINGTISNPTTCFTAIIQVNLRHIQLRTG